MYNIQIKDQENKGKSWLFLVEVDDLEFKVEVDKDYWQELTDGKYRSAELVKKSFKFLLDREPKERILKEFNIRVINAYFPEYEENIKGT